MRMWAQSHLCQKPQRCIFSPDRCFRVGPSQFLAQQSQLPPYLRLPGSTGCAAQLVTRAGRCSTSSAKNSKTTATN